MDNVKLEKGFSQVCVWEACVVGESEIEKFTEFMKQQYGVRVQYLEEIKTLPDLENGKPVPNTGNRNDLFFAIHDDDIGIFAIPRLMVGIRWIEDVLLDATYHSPIYPERIFKYKRW